MVTNRRREAYPTWIRVSSGSEAETEVFLNVLKEVMGKTI
jgi:histidinol-phosphate/aromatic aminotransferase/cobyric acid decarboxylase-like protein